MKEIVQRRLSSEKIARVIAVLCASEEVTLSQDKRSFLAFVVSELSTRADSRAIEIMLNLPRDELSGQSIARVITEQRLDEALRRRLCDIVFIQYPKG